MGVVEGCCGDPGREAGADGPAGSLEADAAARTGDSEALVDALEPSAAFAKEGCDAEPSP